MKKYKTSQSGVALLMSLGILAILSILSVAFSTNMRLMERTSRDFIYEMQARYLAQGGIEYAVAELKEDARNSFTYDGIGVNDELNPADIDFPQDITGKIEVNVIDTARQININTASSSLLACLPGIEGMAGDIITQRSRMPNNKFLTKQSVALSNSRIDFDDIKNYITTNTYIDKNVQGQDGSEQERSAVNINTLLNQARQGDTAAEEILKKILKIVDGIGDSRASNIINALSNPPAPHSFPIDSWTEFLETVDSASGIGDTLLNTINEMFNPNRRKPSGTIATEFCFHSGGTYEITATASVSKGTQTLARKTITGTIKVFDLENQTTMQQFRGEDANFNEVLDPGEDINGNNNLDIPTYERITWKDSCPVKSDDNWILTPSIKYNYNPLTEYYTIPDSIKLGYWDDFEDTGYSKSQWREVTGRRTITDGSENILGGWGRTSMSIFKSGGQPRIDLYVSDPEKRDRWKFQRQYIQVFLSDNHTMEWTVPPALRRATQSEAWRHSASSRLGFKGYPGTTVDSSVLHTINHDNSYYGYLPAAFELWIRPVTNPLDNSYKDEDEGDHPVRETEDPVRHGWNTIFKVWSLENINYAEEEYIGVDPPRPLSVVELMPTQYVFPGVVRVFSPYNDFWQRSFWDNFRIIPATDSSNSKYGRGIYTSTGITPESYPVDWGTIYFTVTILETPDDENEIVRLQTSTTGTDDYSSTIIPPSGRISGANSASVNYRATLETAGIISGLYKPFEIPVLEDVWITYLPKTKVLYYREITAD